MLGGKAQSFHVIVTPEGASILAPKRSAEIGSIAEAVTGSADAEIMVPIRLGSVSILQLMVELQLVNTLTALVLVYVAQGLPLAIMILSEFMGQVPSELKDAARCDGVDEFRIFFQVVVPLIRPAIATVAVFTMVPIWNDLWFPLILAPSESTQTITLGIQQFVGQYATDWNAVLASLSLAIVPVVTLYALFSRQLIRGITAGAVK